MIFMDKPQNGFAVIKIILLVIIGVIALSGVIWSIVYFSQQPESQQQIKQKRCGDGVCDAIEKTNSNLCPQDCEAYDKNQSSEQQQPDDQITAQQTGQQPNKNITFIEDLKYSSINSDAVKLDMYFPSKTCSGRLPLVVMIHGGAFKGGDKRQVKTTYLTDNCYAVASINYRLSGEAIFPAGNQDVKAAVRWLRANAGKYNLDPEHFGAIGGSAGGYYASFLGVAGDAKEFDVGDNLEYSSAVQAVVDEFGPVDFSTLAQDRVDAKLATDTAESNYVGCDISSAACESSTKASPVNYASKEDAPFFILHGENDKTIPIKQSQDFYKKLKNAGVSATLITIPNAGHGGPEFDDYESRIMEFFNKYLKK